MRKIQISKIEMLNKDLKIVTGLTAIEVHNEMKNYEPFPKDASEMELNSQKDKNDNLAAKCMIRELNKLNRSINMKMGEGEKDILKGHEIDLVEGIFGKSGESHDGINDPLEGTMLSVRKEDGVSSVIALTKPDGFINVPMRVMYMQKMYAPMVEGLSINDGAHETLLKVTKGLDVGIEKIRVTVLDRLRNKEIIDSLVKFEEKGLELNLINAGDLLPSIVSSTVPDVIGKYNIVLGIGGVPEGMIAAACAKATGNTFVEAIWQLEANGAFSSNGKVLKLDDLIPGKREDIAVELAHITKDTKYTNQKGVRQIENEKNQFVVDFTSININGVSFNSQKYNQKD